MERAILIVSFGRPPNTTNKELIEFVKTAVIREGGGRHPQDPLFGHRENIVVTYVDKHFR